MSAIQSFHEVRFPTDIALGAVGGPSRRTEVVTLASGKEQRNARWSASRRKYNAGYGVKTLDDLSEVLSFFEERRGKLFGFRYRDPLDYKSSKPKDNVTFSDQHIGVGDGTKSDFQLIKTYGTGEAAWQRQINKPVIGTVLLSIDDVEKVQGPDFTIEVATGVIELNIAPNNGAIIKAGFEFDVPVRFDTDEVLVNLTTFLAGDIASIPLVELSL
ncbi:MAG: DUF2460 domain-containing protein [Rhizobiales bacterium]|nr:DUF2460 domain-containing protein [Hyphomicrobiales bacterium]